MSLKIAEFDQTFQRDVTALWNASLVADPIDDRIFVRKILCDENFNPRHALVAFGDGRIVGFALGIKRKFPYMERGLEPEKAWVSVLFTDKAERRQGIASELVHTLEERLSEGGTKKIVLASYSPNYFFPGVDRDAYVPALRFFEARGYEKTGEAFSMRRSLKGYTIPAPVLAHRRTLEQKGFSFEPFSLLRCQELLEFLKTSFGGGWKRGALQAILRDDAPRTITLALLDGKICGFCQRAFDENPERFGPFGVREDLRSTGIGAVLFHETMRNMAADGIGNAFFLSTDEPGARFYRRNGMSVYRTHFKYEKKIEVRP